MPCTQSQALEPGAKLGEYSPSGVYEARAYAHIKLQQWMEAVQDASKAIELDPSNVKAYLRKGCAASQQAALQLMSLACWGLEGGRQSVATSLRAGAGCLASRVQALKA